MGGVGYFFKGLLDTLFDLVCACNTEVYIVQNKFVAAMKCERHMREFEGSYRHSYVCNRLS
jgi:hypothetical protein